MTAPRRALQIAIATVLLGQLFAADASAQPPAETQDQVSAAQVRELAEAFRLQQQSLAELKAEFERRSAALAELGARIEQLASRAPTAGTPPAAAQQPPPTAPRPPDEPVATTAASVPPRFGFYGDAKVRFETLNQDYDGCVGCPNRKRGRLRLRFGAEGTLSPDFTAVMGFGVGEINDPNTVYVNLGNNLSRKVATWDRGYVNYHPQRASWFDVTAGKFPYTWLRSSMVFDVDSYPEGVSERFSFDLPHAGMVKKVGAQGFQIILNEQPGDLHSVLAGEQFTVRLTPHPSVSTVVAATAVSITRPEFSLRALLDGSDVGVRNTNAVVIRSGQAFYASGFHYANVIVENAIRTRWEAMPITVGLEYQKNLAAASDLDTALSFRLDAGRAQRRGDWELGFHVFRVEQDAILAALGESDWRAPSNVLQQRYAVNRMLHSNVQLSWTLYRGRTLDTSLPGALRAPGLAPGVFDPWTNRMYFDITYRY